MTLSVLNAMRLFDRMYTRSAIEDLLGVSFTPEQKEFLRTIPFTAETLAACAGTHVLFPSPPLSLTDMYELFPEHFAVDWLELHGMQEPECSRVCMPAQWHLLQKKALPGSFNRTWEQQQGMLVHDEQIPSAALLTFASLLLRDARKYHLLDTNVFVRTSDLTPGGRIVIAERRFVCVSSYLPDNASSRFVGIRTERKPTILPANLS